MQNILSAVCLFKDLLRHAGSVVIPWKSIWKTESCWQRYTQKNKSYNTELSFFRIQPHEIRTRLCCRFKPAKFTPGGTSQCFLWKMCMANRVTEGAGWGGPKGLCKYQGQFTQLSGKKRWPVCPIKVCQKKSPSFSGYSSEWLSILECYWHQNLLRIIECILKPRTK